MCVCVCECVYVCVCVCVTSGNKRNRFILEMEYYF